MEGEEAQKKFKGLKKPQVQVHLEHWRNLNMYHGPEDERGGMLDVEHDVA